MVSRVIPVQPFDLVIFGATGDLARRKIIPGLYNRMRVGQMPAEARIIGAARKSLDTEGFRALVSDALDEFSKEQDPDEAARAQFLAALDYVPVDARGDGGWDTLKGLLRDDVTRAFYLSVGPSLFNDIAARLSKHGLANETSRIVVEKPFGHDLETARALNASLAQHFLETQIYRIDHYLGKETVQNLMALRFANALFEPLWNARHIDHVQISVAETIGVAGRGGYYDRSGAMRDMVQNHLMQLLCLTAMEPPSQYQPDSVRDEKLKVISALAPLSSQEIVRGQYRSEDGTDDYLVDSDNPDSRTESFVALKVGIGNWRWAGVPFYLRTGKKLRSRFSEITVQFKPAPHAIFADMENRRGNALVIRLQPNEGITLSMTIKEPGPGGMRLIDVPLDMSFAEALGPDAETVANAYERLVMDVIRGDQTLFMRGDEVEAAWAWIDPVEKNWAEASDRPAAYDPGSTGPEDALMLMHKDGRKWRDLRT